MKKQIWSLPSLMHVGKKQHYQFQHEMTFNGFHVELARIVGAV